METLLLSAVVAAIVSAGVAWGFESARTWIRGLLWPRLVLASVIGAILAILLGIAAWGNLDRPEAFGFAFGAGPSYGVLFGSAVAFLMYALKDLPALD